MPGQTRHALILRIFRSLPAGEPLPVAEVVEGLLHAGHDFGPAATGHTDYVTLTQATLTRMVDRGELVEGADPDGHATWSRPGPLLAGTHRLAPTGTAASPSPQPPLTTGNEIAAAFCVASVVLGVLILLVAPLINP